jgi:hypothetical protein
VFFGGIFVFFGGKNDGAVFVFFGGIFIFFGEKKVGAILYFLGYFCLFLSIALETFSVIFGWANQK